MKSILITATVVGVAIAGLLLYMQQTDKPKSKLKQTGEDLKRNFNEALVM